MQNSDSLEIKKVIKVKMQNGLDFEIFKREVFDVNGVSDFVAFENSTDPDFIIFGPYGNDIPKPGSYQRIGYFCENITPDLSICDWAFGIPRDEEIKNPKYKRIQWHGFEPKLLIKNLSDNDINRILSEKTKFCNFIYSNRVPYREEFFKQLSKYKKVDSPSKSMKNMPPIDSQFSGDFWDQKRQFLNQYKFTIAFENYAYPGYQTEKLYDAMLVNSLPIYCGDDFVDEIFNKNSFVNFADYVDDKKGKFLKKVERLSQQTFVDIRPQHFRKPHHHLSRKLKLYGRRFKMKYQFNNLDFSPLIDRIKEIDNNPDLYISYLKQPWLINNQVPEHTLSKNRWLEIFGVTPKR